MTLMCSSLLLQQFPGSHVRLIWMILEMKLGWPYSCFIGCRFQDLFLIAYSILVQLPSSFFSEHFVSVNVVYPYNNIDTIAPWKKLRLYIYIYIYIYMCVCVCVCIYIYNSMKNSFDSSPKCLNFVLSFISELVQLILKFLKTIALLWGL